MHKFVILEGIKEGNRFFTMYDPTRDYRYLKDGTVAYNIVGYADTIQEAQLKILPDVLQLALIKERAEKDAALHKELPHVKEERTVGEFQRLLERVGIWALTIRHARNGNYFVNINGSNDDGDAPTLIQALRDARDISEYEENQNKEE